MNDLAKKFVKNLPFLRHLFLERDQLRNERDRLTRERDSLKVEGEKLKRERDQEAREKNQLKAKLDLLRVHPGHFYSPIPSIEEIRAREKEIFDHIPREMAEIDLNEEQQLCLLEELKKYHEDLPFDAHKKEGLRFYYDNSAFRYGDATVLFCMIRHMQPKRIIEVGAGHSSCAILDTNEFFFDNSISCTFIEPHAELFLSLVKESDKSGIELIQKKLQNVDPDSFLDLSEGDILFIDSSHVCKTDSDVNHLFFEVLPRLKSGTYVGFHDIFYPLEYLKEWIYEGRAWNEIYLLRAFLQYNDAFKIQFFNHFLYRFHKDALESALPLCINGCGSTIWLRKA